MCPSVYPGSLDSFTDPLASDRLDSPSHATLHADKHDAIEKIETELGVNPKTIDDTISPGATPTSVANYLDMVANILKSIKGVANWYTAAAASIATIWAKFNATTGHTHTAAADDGPKLDHGASLTGLGDDDHPQYALDTDLNTHKTANPIDHPDWVVITPTLQSYATEPAGAAGRVFYDSTKKCPKFHNGAKWLPMGGVVLKRLTLINEAFTAGVTKDISFSGAFQFGKILKIRVEKNPTGVEAGYIYIRFYADSGYVNEISQQYSIDLATVDISSQYVCHVPLGEAVPYALDGTILYARVQCQRTLNLDLQITIEESWE